MSAPENRPTIPAKLRLEERVRRSCRLRQFSLRTEEAYWGWVRQFIIYHGKRHPKEMGEPEVRDFDSLAPLAHPFRAS